MDWIFENIELVLILSGVIIEILLRVIPTQGNWSLVHLVLKILDGLIKNKSTAKSTLGENKEFRLGSKPRISLREKWSLRSNKY